MYLIYDGGGSTRGLIDTAGQPSTTQLYNFDAFGNRLGGGSAALTPLLYRGEYFDATLEQYHLRARYFDTRTGRFTTFDGFEASTATPQRLHKYLYAGANPIWYADPSGNDFSAIAQLAVTAIKKIGFAMLAGAVTGATTGALIGGGAAGALHLLQHGTTDGLWDAIGNGALHGALYGAIIGASSFNPVLLAVTVNIVFGISLYHTGPLLVDPDIKPQTKVALLAFLILGARGAVKSNINAYNYTSEMVAYGRMDKAKLVETATQPDGTAQKLAGLFGRSDLAQAEANLRLAQQGKLKIPDGVTREHLLAYRQVALETSHRYANNRVRPDGVKLQMTRALICDQLLYRADVAGSTLAQPAEVDE
jgi:RHS repeat-associated protein